MNKKKRIILITILSIILVVLLTAFVFATINYASSKQAHADYSDLTNTDIVSFNQYVKQEYINFDMTQSVVLNNIDYYSSGDIFYTKITYNRNGGGSFFVYCQNFDNIIFNGGGYDNGTHDAINTVSVSGYGISIYTANNNVNINNFYIINLSKMYGRGNEPNIEQCRQIFKAKSYAYNSGSAMYYGLNKNDMLQNLVYDFNTGLISGYPNNITQSTVSYNTNGVLIFNAVHADNYTPYWLINFKTIIPKGSVITFNINSYTTYSGVGFAFCYADENEQYITSLPTTQNSNAPFNYSFVTQKDISALYLIEQSSTTWTQGTILTIYSATIDVQFSDDYQFDLLAQYDLGYGDAETYYTQGYGRQIIWGEGYDTGYTRGVSEGTLSDGWTFLSTMFSGVGSIFSIEIFPNITLGTFVMIPLLLGLIFFIVKLSRGGS